MIREWYFQVMGQEIGPMSGAELKAKVFSGQIQPDTLIRRGADGKWMFGGRIKGLFPEESPAPAPPPAAPIPLASDKPKSSATTPSATGTKRPGSPDASAKPAANSPAKPIEPVSFIPIVEEKVADPPSVEFYNFVGFREAISPVLHDAVKQFAVDRNLTVSQLNRLALAHFVQRPELVSDLSVTAVASVPQPVSAKSNSDGRDPLSELEQVEVGTFRFTLFNSGHSSIEIDSAALIPESIDERSYDTIDSQSHPALDHHGHTPVQLTKLVIGKPVRIGLDVSIRPQATKDVVIWFYGDSADFKKVRGQLLVGHGENLGMSEFFTITLHGDSPRPSET